MTLKLAEMDLPALIDFPLAINPRSENEKPADIDLPSTSATVLGDSDDMVTDVPIPGYFE